MGCVLMKREDTTSSNMGPMHEALDRMRNAYLSGRGVRLTWEELEAMSRSILGEIWEQESPLDATPN